MANTIKFNIKGEQLLNNTHYFTAPQRREIELWQLRRGEIITVEDCLGRHFRARVIESQAGKIGIYVFEACLSGMEPPVDILLLQALPSKERMEWIIQKSVELGVGMILPFKSAHSVSLDELKQSKAHRWSIVALKAAKQCRRATAPQVLSYTDFLHALSFAQNYELKMMLWQGASMSIASQLSGIGQRQRVALLVGPEGGWSESEIREAEETGFTTVSLGPRILRTETAAIIATGLIQYFFGDLGR
ncbi:MAG: RsmE family RNA methyltransferase [bacterium]